jgi:hypothetical protein
MEPAIDNAFTETTIARVFTELTMDKSEPDMNPTGGTPSETNDSIEGTIGGGGRAWKDGGVNFRENMNVTNALASGENGTNGKRWREAEVRIHSEPGF